MKRLAHTLIAAALPFVFAVTTPAAADWPERPIEMLVPFPAGTTTDIVARLVGEALSQRLGQPVIVENRPGATGAIAMQALAAAEPDGYTIGLGTGTTQAVAVSLNPNLPYDPLTDFEPVAMIGGGPYVLVAGPSKGFQTYEELVEYAQANPGEVTYGTVGEASTANLLTLYFADLAGIELMHIPYSAATQAALDNVAGRIDMQWSTYGSMQSFIEEGELTALAVSSRQRMAELPDVPTGIEKGLNDFNVLVWFAVVAPAGTPREIIDQMNAAINDALENDERMREALLTQGIPPEPGTPEDLQERIRTEIDIWKGVAERADIQPQ